MRQSIVGIVLTLLLGSCGGDLGSPTAPVAVTPAAPSGATSGIDQPDVAAASRPERVTWTDVLQDVDPCTGILQEITIAWACLQDGGEVVTCRRTITATPTGYVGHGTYSTVDNDHVIAWRITDTLRNDAGDRVKIQYRSVYDPTTGTWRVEDYKLTCLSR